MRSLFALLLFAAPLRAGYSAPNYLDGGQSADGRYVVTAEATAKGQTHNGPHKWAFTWKDTSKGETRTFEAKGVQGGQIYGHLFVPPGGETFALWNHVTLWTEGKSNDHAAGCLPPKDDTDAWRKQSAFAKRLIIFSSKDGSIVKEFAVADFLAPKEWAGVLPVFNRVHWIVDYAPLSYRNSLRAGYAFYRINPDSSILEFRIVPLKSAKDKSGRAVRVSLVVGRILAADETLTDEAKIPVRPFLGPDKSQDHDNKVREGYVPSLDPVRKEGQFTVAPVPPASIPQFQPAKLIKGGFAKLDTPAWLPERKILVFTDLEAKKLFKLTDGKNVAELGDGGRGKVGPDGLWYGLFAESLVSWKPGEGKPAQLAANAQLNDIAIGAKFAYFTTLKDPEKGRLTIVDTRDGKQRVAFDGEKEPTLTNPNGIALSPDGKHLYVGISSYKEKKHTGIYRFPIQNDGGLDLAVGKKAKWYNATAPDGIAVDPAGNVFATLGNAVVIANPDGKKIGELKIPKASGTNLCFGGPDGKTLYVTTNTALYAFEPKAAE